MKIFNWICIALFIVFAALQYNDPDPYVWMPIYLYTALLCYMAIKKRYYPYLYIAGIAVFVCYGAILFFDKTGVINWVSEHHAESILQSMQAEQPWIEKTREFGGLLITVVVLVINMAWLYRQNSVSHFSIH